MIESVQSAMQDALTAGSLWGYVLTFAGGVIAGFTPCVYPILPLTVGYIGNTAAGQRWKGFILSLVLVGSMALVYAVFGVVAAAAGMRFGSIWGNGWAVFAIAWFFILMALFLMDVFSFPVPGFLRQLGGTSTRKNGYAEAILIGAVSGLVVSPCTGPILGLVLVGVAATATQASGFDYITGMLDGGVKLFLFGLGQGILILLGGTFVSLLAYLPKSGQWMVNLKKAFALLILFGASLMLIHVGQSTDFPNLTCILAGMENDDSHISDAPTAAISDLQHAEEGMAPDFTLKCLSGEMVRLSDHRGKSAAIMVFFSTWCSACIAEIPAINRFVEENRDKNIQVYGIAVEQPQSIIEQFAKRNHLAYPILLDTSGDVTDAYNIQGIPVVIAIDRRGMVIYRGHSLPRFEDIGVFTN